MWRFREGSGFWREPASLVLPFVFTTFQNFSMPFPSQTPSQGAGGASNGEEITLQAGCLQLALQFAQSNLPKHQDNMKRLDLSYRVTASSLLPSVWAVTQKKTKNYLDSLALFLTFHMKLRETHSRPLHRLLIWHCNPWYLSVIHKKRHLIWSQSCRRAFVIQWVSTEGIHIYNAYIELYLLYILGLKTGHTSVLADNYTFLPYNPKDFKDIH